jgi:hypothetical protein
MNLEQLGVAVRSALGTGAAFRYLNARLIIQIGVNLDDLTPSQNADPSLLRRVQETLQRMGIRHGGAPA